MERNALRSVLANGAVWRALRLLAFSGTCLFDGYFLTIKKGYHVGIGHFFQYAGHGAMRFGISFERTVIVFKEVAFFHSRHSKSFKLRVARRNFARSGGQLYAVGHYVAKHGPFFFGFPFCFLRITGLVYRTWCRFGARCAFGSRCVGCALFGLVVSLRQVRRIGFFVMQRYLHLRF